MSSLLCGPMWDVVGKANGYNVGWLMRGKRDDGVHRLALGWVAGLHLRIGHGLGDTSNA